MKLNLDVLKTVADCDSVIRIVTEEKTFLERRLRNLGENLEIKGKKTHIIRERMTSITAIIEGYEAALKVITDTKHKGRLELNLSREKTKLIALQNREADYNVYNLVEDEIDHQQIDAQITVLNNAIENLEARKAALAA